MSFRDIDEIAETVYRRSAARLDELRAANQRISAENRALVEQSAQRIRRTLQQAEARERQAEEVQSPHREEPWPAQEQQSGMLRPAHRTQSEELRQQQEAVARAAAARQSRNVVTPIDDDGDEEGEYYRRNSWLV
ncbi:hypothetical protein [Nocardia sp. NBC_01329]|uniref:hypothetical protein n=1 Tax=Nocardia sp. NBC_01329 TaxID=2903594 RepID=UPI002E10CB79|nr:hypothetical protein OG405_00705 [Nocardia sp. NBC_01329]